MAGDGAPTSMRIVLGAGTVRMTDEALAQFAASASLPGCMRAAAMPDLHPGPGIPVGAAFAMADIVYPHLVGSDIGCGARVLFTTLDRVSRDKLERKLRHAFADGEPALDGQSPAELFQVVWSNGPPGLLSLPGLPELLSELCRAEPVQHGLPPSGSTENATAPLGTIGAGNHFAEVSLVRHVVDDAAASRLGIVKGGVTVVVHSGSRGLGDAIGARWRDRPVQDEALRVYLGEHAGACRFATTNRLLLGYRLLRCLGVTQAADVLGQFDIIHNDVRQERLGAETLWVHRKGAAPAHQGAPTVVLGSRGAPSWVMLGHGLEAALSSVAHGAGRRMSRSMARAKLEGRFRAEDLKRTPLGGRVLCDDAALLYEEHPDAYKPIEQVIVALEEADVAHRVASLEPIITVKL